MQPLSGLLVLDFSTLLPGPLASLMLAEAGAEVIKIERPGGEEMRSFAPMWEGESAAFGLLNRGKKVVTLDLKKTCRLAHGNSDASASCFVVILRCEPFSASLEG